MAGETTTDMTDLERKCIDAGVKMTGQRRVILDVLTRAEDHPSAETVYQRSKEVDPTISISTVYRTLNLLDQLNLVRKHEFKQNYAQFEANLEHHHHLVDVETGEVIEFCNEEVEALIQKVAGELGYELADHRLELYGYKKA